MILGSHVSTAGGYHKAVQRAVDVGCECVQVFASPPGRWVVSPIKPRVKPEPGWKLIRGKKRRFDRWTAKQIPSEEMVKWTDAISSSGLSHPVAHGSYLINVASPDRELLQKSINALVVELERGNELHLDGLVVHPGAFVDSNERSGLKRVVAAVTETLERVPPGSCTLLLENTAGQGSCLGHTFEQLAYMIEGVDQPDRVGICFDTCHAFAAGYELNTARGFQEMVQQLQDLLPAGTIRALHLNDSKKALGSRVDRHEHIGRGEIGLAGFRFMMGEPMFNVLPGYLETEKGIDEQTGDDWDVINLGVLRELR